MLSLLGELWPKLSLPCDIEDGRPIHMTTLTPQRPERVTIVEGARRFGLTTQAIWKAIDKGILKAAKRGGRYLMAYDDLAEVAPLLQKRTKPTTMTRRPVVSEISAQCLDLFVAGKDPITVARELRQDLFVVERQWDQWRAMQLKYQHTKQAPCVLEHRGPCSGPPSLEAMLCAAHAEQATTLSPEQAALLEGKSIPTALRCQACDEMTDQGVCLACLSAVRVAMEDGCLVVRAGKRVIKVIDGPELVALLPSAAPTVSLSEPEPVVSPISPTTHTPHAPISASQAIAKVKQAIGFDR